MCQLLGINSQQRFDTTPLLADFFRRGGNTDNHADGWGIASFDSFDNLQLIKHESAAAHCPQVRTFLQQRQLSDRLIAHIRKATFGERLVENTQPFRRSLWGSDWVFAHNGDLHHFYPEPNSLFPVKGGTDSERAFCSLLSDLVQQFDLFHPKLRTLLHFLQKQSDAIAHHGNFNYLLGNNQFLIAYASSELYWTEIVQPQLPISLLDSRKVIRALSGKQCNSTIIVATKPLTSGEVWYPMGKGEIRLFSHGQPVIHLAGVRQSSSVKQAAVVYI